VLEAGESLEALGGGNGVFEAFDCLPAEHQLDLLFGRVCGREGAGERKIDRERERERERERDKGEVKRTREKFDEWEKQIKVSSMFVCELITRNALVHSCV
jgi:hypothetical protein